MAFPSAAIGAIGTALGGLGQLAGGLNIGENDVDIEGDIKKSMRAKLWSARHYGEKYGFHPLAALGVSPTNLPSVKTGGPNFQKMGQGLNKLLNAGQSEVSKAQIKNLEARTNLINKQAEQIGNDSPEGQAEGVTVTDLPPPVSRAYEPGIKPMEAVYNYKNSAGENVLEFLPSRDAQDYLSESFIDNMKYRVQKEWKNYATGIKRLQSKEINALRNRLDQLEMTHPPRPGYYYAFNFKHGRPIEIKKNKYSGKRLIDSRAFNIQRYTGFGSHRNKP